MKILDKIAFVVFAVLALASVAGCSVNVEPSPGKDGGGTSDNGPDDGLTGADGNGGGGSDGSTTGDDVDDTDPTEDGGGNPNDDVSDGGGQSSQDGGYEGESFDLPNCENTGPVSGTFSNFQYYYDLDMEDGAPPWDEVETDFNGYHKWVGLNPVPDPPNPDEENPQLSVVRRFRCDSEVPPFQRGPVSLVNHSRNSSFSIGFIQVLTSPRGDGDTSHAWDYRQYPIVGPRQALAYGELKKTEDGVCTFYPNCTVYLRDLPEEE